MKKQGSITVFLSLILSLMLSLVCTSMFSVKIASARTQILNGMDIGLYSLFGQYDKKLLEKYDLFALDGSCGGGELKMASVYDNMLAYMKPVLKQNGRKMTVESGGFTGYRLFTDDQGKAFYQQIVQHMKDTLGAQGIQHLLDWAQEREGKVKDAETNGKKAESEKALTSYDSAMNHAEKESQKLLEGEQEQGGNQGGGQMLPENKPEVPVENPVTVIRKIMKLGILKLVIPMEHTISSEEISEKKLVSKRKLQKGLPVLDGCTADDSYTAGLLFQQYLMNKLGCFQNPSQGSLKYPIEYILSGKKSDLDNLKSVAHKLLLVREGVNFACLAADSVKRSQVEALALSIASSFLIPPAASAIAAAIMFCWSYAESILDVRELFDGGKVPLIKKSADWQISLENLPRLMEGLDSVRKGSTHGMSYEDYLQVFLMTTGLEKKVMRAMDMLELEIRTADGRTDFSMDSCITSIEAAVDVDVEGKKKFTVTRQYCYE